MSTSGISFSGIASGLDTDSIVTRLMQLESIGVQRLQSRQAAIQDKMGLYSQFRSQLTALRSAAGTLNNISAFSAIKATSSDSTIATIAPGSNSGQGTYQLKTFQLAQAQKLSSTFQNDTTTALGLTGTFKVNGKEVQVTASDSLAGIAEKITSAGGDVIGSVINGGTGLATLTMTSSKSGMANNVKLEEVSGNVLSTLGFLTTSVRQPITNGAKTFAALSATDKLNKFAGFTATGPTNVTVNGTSVSIDPTTDTLNSLATKLSAVPGVTATVVSGTENGRTVYRLEVTGASTPTFGEEGNVFVDLGILKRSSELVSAQDAYYSIDNIQLVGDSNTVTSAIPGSTITLLQADATNGKSTTLTLTRDDSTIKANIKSFTDAYNNLVAFMKDNTKFDKDTYQSGPLFGDSITNQISSELSTSLFTTISGLANLTNLGALGITFDSAGKLTVNDSTLSAKLSSDPTAVAKVFRAAGTATGDGLSFISSTSKTAATGAGSYAVNITQLATKSSVTAGTAMTGPLATGETLTFKGGPFPADGLTLYVPSGSDISSVVNQINSDSRFKDYVVASNEGGTLKITSSRYGTPGRFTVTSSVAAGPGTTGIGTVGESTVYDGLDVQGTIDGREATGSGQFLTATDVSANTTSNGMQIQYTGTALGNVGTVQLTKGIAALLAEKLDGYTTSTTGFLSAADKALQDQYDDLGKSITDQQSRLAAKEQSLREKFQRMESALQAAQAQQQRLTALLGNS